MRAPTALLLLLCLTPTMAHATDDVNTTIDSVLEAYGGRERVAGIKAFRLEGTMQAVRRGEQADVIRIIEHPDRFALMLRYPSQTEVREFRNGRAWQGSDPDQLKPAEGPPGDAIALQWARVSIVRLLDEQRVRVHQGKASEVTTILELRVGPNLWVRALIDKSTHHVLATQSAMLVGEQGMLFETHYSDFRKVDGVLFAFHEEKYAGGMHMGSIDVRQIEINPPAERLRLPPAIRESAF